MIFCLIIHSQFGVKYGRGWVENFFFQMFAWKCRGAAAREYLVIACHLREKMSITTENDPMSKDLWNTKREKHYRKSLIPIRYLHLLLQYLSPFFLFIWRKTFERLTERDSLSQKFCKKKRLSIFSTLIGNLFLLQLLKQKWAYNIW